MGIFVIILLILATVFACIAAFSRGDAGWPHFGWLALACLAAALTIQTF